jgi:hypothetical protein
MFYDMLVCMVLVPYFMHANNPSKSKVNELSWRFFFILAYIAHAVPCVILEVFLAGVLAVTHQLG